ncbi:conserved oligomeric Golgi complex subunit 8 [Anabrus simplex]|uniref:conserved oligomeric Golgi complex subunit 8 n=1 Tax=Anabrus simplex TaxID=316456 RepID=UPI0035A2834C
MDLETENVMKILFNNNIRDEWKDNPDFALYLSKLGSYGLEQLKKEPERLSEEKAAVLEQTQELAFTNYKTFIQTAECSREICKQFSNVEDRLTSLIERLPELSRKCQEFSRASADINTHRRLNSLTLTRNAQLLEILELPQLMDTCIRNGHFEEALQLAGYVRHLGKKHSSIPIIASIVKDVESSWLMMLHQLLAQLRTDLQLQGCLQVVGYLRSMQLFSEAELRLKYLQCRDTWLQNLLAAIPTADAKEHLNRTIELTRIHLFTILTQYKATFTDEDPIIPSTRDQNINENAIIFSWLTEKILQFLKTLEHDLSRGVGKSLEGIIGQCMCFGLSFSRIGADFRGLLAPIFVRTVTQLCDSSIKKATKKFEHDMEHFTLSKTQPSIIRSATLASHSIKQEQPPQSLLEFYPLAEYCNGIIDAFNEVRLCMPIAVAQNVTNQLQESLLSISRGILAFYRQEQQALNQIEKDNFSRMCTLFADELVPYIQKCLHLVFVPANLASHLGITLHQVQKEGITYLDQDAILEPICTLLPVKVLPPISIKSEETSITTKVAEEKLLAKNSDVITSSENPLESAVVPNLLDATSSTVLHSETADSSGETPALG